MISVLLLIFSYYWEINLHGSLMFQYVFILDYLPQCVCLVNSLGIDSIFQSKGQTCLLPIIKYSVSLHPGFLPCKTTHCTHRCYSLFLHHSDENQSQNLATNIIVRNKQFFISVLGISCCLPASMKLANCLVCKQGASQLSE